MIEVIVVLAALLGIVALVGSGARLAFGGGSPSRDRQPFSGNAFVYGLLASTSLGVFAVNSPNVWVTGLTLGACVAALYLPASMLGEGKRLYIEIISLILSVIGLAVTVAGYFSPAEQCVPADAGRRLLGLAIVLLAIAGGAVLAWIRQLLHPMGFGGLALAVYGAVEVGVFLASPVGVSLFNLGALGWVVALVAAAGLGFAASVWPGLVITVASATVALAGLWSLLYGAETCAAGIDVGGLSTLVGFAGVFAFFSVFRRRRR